MADRDRHRRRRLPTHRQRPRGPHRRTLGGLTGAEAVLSMNGGPLRRRCSLDGIAGADAASANGSSRFQQTPGGGPRNPRPLADDRLRPPSASKVGNSPTLAIVQECPWPPGARPPSRREIPAAGSLNRASGPESRSRRRLGPRRSREEIAPYPKESGTVSKEILAPPARDFTSPPSPGNRDSQISSHAGWPCGRFCFWCDPAVSKHLHRPRTTAPWERKQPRRADSACGRMRVLLPFQTSSLGGSNPGTEGCWI